MDDGLVFMRGFRTSTAPIPLSVCVVLQHIDGVSHFSLDENLFRGFFLALLQDKSHISVAPFQASILYLGGDWHAMTDWGVLSRIWTLDVDSNYGYNYTPCVLSLPRILWGLHVAAQWDNLGKISAGREVNPACFSGCKIRNSLYANPELKHKIWTCLCWVCSSPNIAINLNVVIQNFIEIHDLKQCLQFMLLHQSLFNM